MFTTTALFAYRPDRAACDIPFTHTSPSRVGVGTTLEEQLDQLGVTRACHGVVQGRPAVLAIAPRDVGAGIEQGPCSTTTRDARQATRLHERRMARAIEAIRIRAFTKRRLDGLQIVLAQRGLEPRLCVLCVMPVLVGHRDPK